MSADEDLDPTSVAEGFYWLLFAIKDRIDHVDVYIEPGNNYVYVTDYGRVATREWHPDEPRRDCPVRK